MTIKEDDDTVSSSVLEEQSLQPKSGENSVVTKISKILSLRFVIIASVIVLVILCCLSVWLASYIGSSNALNTLNSDLIVSVEQKIMNYMRDRLTPIIAAGDAMAMDYNTGVAPQNSTFQKYYLMSKYLSFRANSIGYFVATPASAVFCIIEKGSGANLQLLFAEQYYGEYGYVFNPVLNTTLVTLGTPLPRAPYQVHQQDYYNISSDLFAKYNTDKVFGPPYVPPTGSVAVYYATKIYNPLIYMQLGEKVPVGIVKLNVGLLNIQQFLANITLIGRGYVLVAEENNLVIGGSINCSAINPSQRVHLYDLIDQQAGALMQSLASQFGGNLNNAPSLQGLQVTSKGSDYRVTRFKFEILNLKWNVFFVMYQEDLQKTTNLNTGISVGVALGCSLIGLLMSIMIGWMITQPMKYLERQLGLIKKFDLDKVHFSSSPFGEVSSIYKSLGEMVYWLNEFKSFIPESVFSQLKDMDGTSSMDEMSATNKKNQVQPIQAQHSSFLSKQDHHESQRHHSSSMKSKSSISEKSSILLNKAKNTTLFKLGLSHKECMVISVRLMGLSSLSKDVIENVIARVFKSLGAITKTISGDLQIFSIEEMQLSLAVNKSNTNNGKLANKAFETALKISKALSQDLANNHHNKNNNVAISHSVGVCCGEALIGNLGTTSLRYYSIAGDITARAKQLAMYGEKYNVRMMTDEKTLLNNPDVRGLFVLRPLDRLCFVNRIGCIEENVPPQKHIETVFELVKSCTVQDDEWLYEIEQHKENQKYAELTDAFSVFNHKVEQLSTSEKDLFETSYQIFSSYQTKCPNDLPLSKLLEVMDRIRGEDAILEALTSYHSTIGLYSENISVHK
ncbi:hypothetical protein C9374_013833 [Naegleria lovaniensis]|uniref:Guanylate cyclase domain-containing protein n=1 Tax=Naegleria lovaniensis TaxID=51637 RepID=A0AA88KPB9_NAELO|nr:uncharacterized protein C9374_013833 [Naegleria lovaniensis]KAG2389273.1 hypothetical protein C9374_013833 [Naegleria lovaniensis]